MGIWDGMKNFINTPFVDHIDAAATLRAEADITLRDQITDMQATIAHVRRQAEIDGQAEIDASDLIMSAHEADIGLGQIDCGGE